MTPADALNDWFLDVICEDAQDIDVHKLRRFLSSVQVIKIECTSDYARINNILNAAQYTDTVVMDQTEKEYPGASVKQLLYLMEDMSKAYHQLENVLLAGDQQTYTCGGLRYWYRPFPKSVLDDGRTNRLLPKEYAKLVVDHVLYGYSGVQGVDSQTGDIIESHCYNLKVEQDEAVEVDKLIYVGKGKTKNKTKVSQGQGKYTTHKTITVKRWLIVTYTEGNQQKKEAVLQPANPVPILKFVVALRLASWWNHPKRDATTLALTEEEMAKLTKEERHHIIVLQQLLFQLVQAVVDPSEVRPTEVYTYKPQSHK